MNLRDIPMRHMAGLKTPRPANVRRAYRRLLQGADGLLETTLEKLTGIVSLILDMLRHDDFDRAVVQLTCRLIATSRAAYDSLRRGHTMAANVMTRDALEILVTAYYLQENRADIKAWLNASTVRERRRFEFSRVVTVFRDEIKQALKHMYSLRSIDVHVNHMATTYVRSRKPAGVNYYLDCSYSPAHGKTILQELLAFAMYQLELLMDCYEGAIDLSAVCTEDDIKVLRREQNVIGERISQFAERAGRAIKDRERADNLTDAEFRFMKAFRQQADILLGRVSSSG